MKKTLIFSLIIIILLPDVTLALAPPVDKCISADQNSTQQCKREACEWENISRNWPDDVGYYVDCEKEFPFDVYLSNEKVGVVDVGNRTNTIDSVNTVNAVKKDTSPIEPIFAMGIAIFLAIITFKILQKRRKD